MPGELTIFAAFSVGGSVRQIVSAPSRESVVATASRRRVRRAPIDTSRGKIAPVDRLGKNPGDLLRERAMLSRCTTPERLFQFVWHIGANEHSFAIGHFFWGLLMNSDRRNQLHTVCDYGVLIASTSKFETILFRGTVARQN